MYHLYFGDETGSPGSLLTFFEIPGLARGRAGAGMIHRIVWRVPSAASLDVLGGAPGRRRTAGPARGRGAGLVRPGGARHRAGGGRGAPTARAARRVGPGHPRRARPGGDRRRRASTARRPRPPSELLVDGLGFDREGAGRFVTRGTERRGTLPGSTRAPRRARRARRGHRAPRRVDLAATTDHVDWGARARDARAATRRGVIDRQYFHSIYFHEPGRRAVRDRDASARASPWTRSRTALGRGAARCRRSTSRIASASRSGSRP